MTDPAARPLASLLRSKRHYLNRTATMLVGLFVMALGIALSVKADIGVSPISCVPYVYSLFLPLSMGETMALLMGSFLVVQALLLPNGSRLGLMAQLPAVFVFSSFVDLAQALVGVAPATTYLVQLLLCLASCVLVAQGVVCVVHARLFLLPADGLVVLLADKRSRDFGGVKIQLDVAMVSFGALSSLLAMDHLYGIREGTVCAALLVGLFVKLFSQLLHRLAPRFA